MATQSVDVTMTATPPGTWGKITRTVTGTECNGTTVPLSRAIVELSGSSDSYTLETGPNGNYGL